ncbi:putative enoyl- hydratase isomerase family protein [Zalerion maritima]|uniref:Enoyl- hydratase isomerase family protein n=1 Tax=Zalerion maritima TaxID=339359 RepID=A0AAD5WPE9_9PEZI|nr:putative enoyl- hydratase isomerase family protein [Zalerion maritima]
MADSTKTSTGSPAPPSLPSPPLFTLQIPAFDPYPGGKVVCTEAVEKGSRIYVLTFTAPADNRLITTVCDTLVRALDILEVAYPSGAVVTTSGIEKFYSNGLDLKHAVENKGFWQESLYRMWARFLTYPMPTIALINGHAFAGGLMTAMHHDYRIFNPKKGFLCLNELEFGAPLKAPMSGIFRIKTSPETYRDLVLESKRFPGPAALEAGLVDGLGGMDGVVKLVKERKLTEKGKTVYGELKMEMYKESVKLLREFEESEREDERNLKMIGERTKEAEAWVRKWAAKEGKTESKL